MQQPALCNGCIFKVQPHDHQCFLSIKWLSFLHMCNHYSLLPCATVHEDFFLAVPQTWVSRIPFEKFWCFYILSGRSSLKKILFFIFYSNLPSIISSKMCTLPPLLQKVKLITLYFLTLVKKCHYLSLKLIIIDAHTFLALYKEKQWRF